MRVESANDARRAGAYRGGRDHPKVVEVRQDEQEQVDHVDDPPRRDKLHEELVDEGDLRDDVGGGVCAGEGGRVLS